MIDLSPSVQPPLLRGLRLDPANPFRLHFIFDPGSRDVPWGGVEGEVDRLSRYFLAALTIPDQDLWVNLSPFESDRIVTESLGRTALGRDMLAQDYLLKQMTASLLHPDHAVGRQFWAEAYRRAGELYGSSGIPTDVFHKIWIVPDRTQIHEQAGGTVYIDQARFRVLLEQDYMAARRRGVVSGANLDRSGAIVGDVLREVLLPAMEREINEGSHFAPLRQLYHSLLLAVWMKDRLRRSFNPLTAVYADRRKTDGITVDASGVEVQQLYQRYLVAYRQGAYEIIREDIDEYSREPIPRKYFSGGESFQEAAASFERVGGPLSVSDRALGVDIDLAAVGPMSRREFLAQVLAGIVAAGVDRNAGQGGAGDLVARNISGLKFDLDRALGGVAEKVNAVEARSGSGAGFTAERIRTLFRERGGVDVMELGKDVDAWVDRVPAFAEIFGGRGGAFQAVCLIAYIESTFGLHTERRVFQTDTRDIAAPFWQLFRSTSDDLDRLFPDEMKGVAPDSHKRALLFMVRLARMVQMYYPRAPREWKAALFVLGYNQGTGRLFSQDTALLLLRQVLRGQIPSPEDTVNSPLQGVFVMHRFLDLFGWRERFMYGPGMAQQQLTLRGLRDTSGVVALPDGFQMFRFASRKGNPEPYLFVVDIDRVRDNDPFGDIDRRYGAPEVARVDLYTLSGVPDNLAYLRSLIKTKPYSNSSGALPRILILNGFRSVDQYKSAETLLALPVGDPGRVLKALRLSGKYGRVRVHPKVFIPGRRIADHAQRQVEQDEPARQLAMSAEDVGGIDLVGAVDEMRAAGAGTDGGAMFSPEQLDRLDHAVNGLVPVIVLISGTHQ